MNEHHTNDDPRPPSVELWVREPTLTSGDSRPREVYERLAALRNGGKIAEVAVKVWGTHARVTEQEPPGDAGSAPARTFRKFEQWAARNGCALGPAFSTHTSGSIVSSERTTVVRFPVVCLAVHDTDGLRAVAPCATDDGVRTVDDCLDMLRAEGEALASLTGDDSKTKRDA